MLVTMLQGQLCGARTDPDAHDRNNDRRQASQGCFSEGVADSTLTFAHVPERVRPHAHRMWSWAGAITACTSAQMIPLGRFGEPDETAAAFEFLMHPSNSFITAQVCCNHGNHIGVQQPML